MCVNNLFCRWNGRDMLELLRGKRIVYVGDSLNRNMWESMVCMLRNSVQNKSKVFEASGSLAFKTDGSYSFLFTVCFSFSISLYNFGQYMIPNVLLVLLKPTIKSMLAYYKWEKYNSEMINEKKNIFLFHLFYFPRFDILVIFQILGWMCE